MTKGFIAAAAALVVGFFAVAEVHAQSRPGAQRPAQTPQSARPAAPQGAGAAPRLERGDINANSLGLVSGGVAGTYIQVAADIASVLDDGDRLRVLPIIGKGSVQNLRDLLFMRGIDLALVQSDVLENFRREGVADIANRVRYVTRLYNEEIHILASREITDIRQLQGRPVNIDLAGSGTAMTSRIIFSRLGIEPQFTTVEQRLGLERLRNGEIAATVFVGGRPVRGVAEFRGDNRFHLLSIPYDQLQDIYLPAQLAHADYPNLIPQNGAVETVAVGTVLAAFNWPTGSDRYRRIARFTEALFSRFEEFQRPPRHPKWQEVNLAASLPGWTRFRAADEWLERNGIGTATGAQEFARFLQTRPGGAAMSQEDYERTFRQFLEWRRAQR